MPFEKGKSGNPGGRPKEAAEVKAVARAHCVAAIEKLAELMNCGNQRVEVAAAQALLDRGSGGMQGVYEQIRKAAASCEGLTKVA